MDSDIAISKKGINRRNLGLRIVLLAFFCIPLFYVYDFYQHFYAYLTGNIITKVITEQWTIVLLSILLFLACLIPLSFRRKAKWTEYGLVSAFFVSLFIEMYGIPFTILFAQRWMYNSDVALPGEVVHFRFLGVGFGMDLAMAWGALLMIFGAVLVIVGWVTLYINVKRNNVVTNGIYMYSRHPQYLGFILIILGWLIGWPTILTVVLAPLLIYKYIRVCQAEEKEITSPEEYEAYRKAVPFLI
ncbi:MAG: isoprenylcysteine carboxylmethyltransferase family protein [Chloroflexota bacterium]|nr:isoprenylcysteine carboxylmethyltransferase family protein [Chloroflexota bacterium]